jgi:hypothetical protein
LGSNQSDFSHLIGRDFPNINFFVKFKSFIKISPAPSLKKRGVKKLGEGEGGVQLKISPLY